MSNKVNFSYYLNMYENNEWIQLPFVRPVFESSTLDESLDTLSLTTPLIRRSTEILPFTLLKLTIIQRPTGSNTDTLVATKYYYVGNVVKTRMTYSDDINNIPPERYLYQFEIEAIEYTKIMERSIADTMTFTRYLGHDYTENSAQIIPERTLSATPSSEAVLPTITATFFSPIAVSTSLVCPKPSTVFVQNGNDALEEMQLIVEYPNGSSTNFGDNSATLTAVSGNYILHYKAKYTTLLQTIVDTTYTYTLSAVETVAPKTDYTVADVIKRLLKYGVTRRDGVEGQKYFFDDITTNFDSITAPEFHFTRSTIFDALMQVGGFVHGIPRLRYPTDNDIATFGASCKGVITYDMLGGNVDITDSLTSNLRYEQSTVNIDEYCGEITSWAENVLNSTDETKGTIKSPSNEGYKTVRAENSEIIIDADTMLISTEYPIYRIVKLEMGYIDPSSRASAIGDITAYVFEAAEYLTLASSKDGAFPKAKKYALRYEQGQRNITGLNFIADSITAAGQNYAIYNIVQRETGCALSASEYKKLAFRVTYIPYISVRATQRKAYKGWDNNNGLIYNQGANSVESESFGEHLKGTIAKLGYPTFTRTYVFTDYTKIPKVGQVLDGCYISKVDLAYETLFIKATLTLMPNFNKVAEYLAINSNYRLYDVSEKQSVDRFVSYNEECIVGDEEVYEASDKSMLANTFQFLNTFWQDSALTSPISVAVVETYSQGSDTSIERFALPCMASSLGNSIMLNFRFEDNFSAGNTASDYDFESKYRNLQQPVPYGNVYGEFQKLKIDFARYIDGLSSWAEQAPGGACCDLPLFSGSAIGTIFSTGNYPLLVAKDSRENINVVYQLHFVANRNSIVIGPALTKNCAFVSKANTAKKAVLWYFNSTINMLSKPTLSGTNLGVNGATYTYNTTNKTATITLPQNTTANTYKAWALIDPTTGEIYVGENGEIPPNATPNTVVFKFANNK